jgi:hypothetical protein
VREQVTERVFAEESSRFSVNFAEIVGDVRLRGYFQSWRYFDEIREELLSEINSIIAPSTWFADTAQKLSELNDWVCVHVRRGNYVGIPHLGLAGADYYERSLKCLDAMIGERDLVVFSDDLDVGIATLGPARERIALALGDPPGTRPIEVLNLMAMSSHIVMANSTFSWWAAWMGRDEGRVVICPRPWFDGERHDERDLIMPEWISIGR